MGVRLARGHPAAARLPVRQINNPSIPYVELSPSMNKPILSVLITGDLNISRHFVQLCEFSVDLCVIAMTQRVAK